VDGISLRPATGCDEEFAWRVTEACMRVYAEQTWSVWDGTADFDPLCDEIISFAGQDIGLTGTVRYLDHWFLERLYLLPAYQNRGIGGFLLERLKKDAETARMAVRLTVLEVNPARRFYERHGFILTHTIPPRHHMEWRADWHSGCGRFIPASA
jgi:GNAT superfamily N-acetyltransferase